ncbi:hypothetical protein DL769_007432 [Monosporascus sp. CRB-8-3]|nr:hypothetical protein DL769_007432 [Monosporascus sp. CRB-8-3]
MGGGPGSCRGVPGREELAAAAAGAQHVHIVADDDAGGANGLIVHELAAFEQPKVKTRKITRSCWECDLNCETCIADTQKICKACGGGYCIVHYDGSTETLCDCTKHPLGSGSPSSANYGLRVLGTEGPPVSRALLTEYPMSARDCGSTPNRGMGDGS